MLKKLDRQAAGHAEKYLQIRCLLGHCAKGVQGQHANWPCQLNHRGRVKRSWPNQRQQTNKQLNKPPNVPTNNQGNKQTPSTMMMLNYFSEVDKGKSQCFKSYLQEYATYLLSLGYCVLKLISFSCHVFVLLGTASLKRLIQYKDGIKITE